MLLLGSLTANHSLATSHFGAAAHVAKLRKEPSSHARTGHRPGGTLVCDSWRPVLAPPPLQPQCRAGSGTTTSEGGWEG